MTPPVEREVLQDLLSELGRIPRMLFVLGDESVVAEMYGDGAGAAFAGGYANIEAESWHVHLKMDDVAGAQVVEAEDHGSPMLYYVRLSGAAGETLLRVYFPNPHMDERGNATAFQPERLALFEAVRDRYTGRGGIVMAHVQRDG